MPPHATSSLPATSPDQLDRRRVLSSKIAAPAVLTYQPSEAALHRAASLAASAVVAPEPRSNAKSRRRERRLLARQIGNDLHSQPIPDHDGNMPSCSDAMLPDPPAEIDYDTEATQPTVPLGSVLLPGCDIAILAGVSSAMGTELSREAAAATGSALRSPDYWAKERAYTLYHSKLPAFGTKPASASALRPLSSWPYATLEAGQSVQICKAPKCLSVCYQSTDPAASSLEPPSSRHDHYHGRYLQQRASLWTSFAAVQKGSFCDGHRNVIQHMTPFTLPAIVRCPSALRADGFVEPNSPCVAPDEQDDGSSVCCLGSYFLAPEAHLRPAVVAAGA